MADLDFHRQIELTDPVLLEGFPGMGLVGKIAVDHLVAELDMVHFADVHCDALPRVAGFGEGESAVRSPVRLYADPDRDLVALQSDVQVSPDAAYEFAGCVADWLDETDTTAVYVAGTEPDEEPNGDGTDGDGAETTVAEDDVVSAGADAAAATEESGDGDVESSDSAATDAGEESSSTATEADRDPRLRGVATAGATDRLAETDLQVPDNAGIVSGPSGALLAHAMETELPAIGVVADTTPRFPDPEAAKAVLERVVEPLAGVDVGVEQLLEHAERVRAAKQRLADQVAAAEDDSSSKATPLRMYQ